jgi:predicted DNA-binding protein (MmcQ/YjbR family)
VRLSCLPRNGRQPGKKVDPCDADLLIALAFMPRCEVIPERARRDDMTYEEFNAFCRALPATSYVVQWGGSHVWKVGGKVFAIGGWQLDEPSFTFKVSDLAYEILKEQPGLRPAPYLASRGMKWIQHFAKPGLSDGELRDYIRQSHIIVSQVLSKKRRIELGLGVP